MANPLIHAVMVLLISGLSTFAKADSWIPAQTKAAVSANSEMIFRVIPGKSMGDVFGFAGEPKGKFAEGQWFRLSDDRYELYRTAQLLNPVAPVFIAVANDGTAVTLDNWHNVGFGDVVVIYNVAGNVLKKYRLVDLYPISTIETMKRSVSSIWWRCETTEPVLDRRGVLEINDSLGGRFTFVLNTGEFNYEAGVGTCNP